MTDPELKAPQPKPFRPVHHYGPGVAALAAEVAGLHGDLLAVLELIGGVDPGLMSQLTAAPVGTWNAVVAAARATLGPVHPAVTTGETRPRQVWTWAPSCQRPGEAFYTRDRDGLRAAWSTLDTPGTGRRAEQVEAWRRTLRKSGPLTEITYDEFHLDANREAGDGTHDG